MPMSFAAEGSFASAMSAPYFMCEVFVVIET